MYERRRFDRAESPFFSPPLLLEDPISPFKDAAVDRRRGFFLFFPFSFLEKGSETVFVREREKRRRRRVVADRIHAVLRSFATLVRYERHLRSALARDFSSDEGREESEDRVNRRIYSPELFTGGEGQILSIYDRNETRKRFTINRINNRETGSTFTSIFRGRIKRKGENTIIASHNEVKPAS